MLEKIAIEKYLENARKPKFIVEEKDFPDIQLNCIHGESPLGDYGMYLVRNGNILSWYNVFPEPFQLRNIYIYGNACPLIIPTYSYCEQQNVPQGGLYGIYLSEFIGPAGEVFISQRFNHHDLSIELTGLESWKKEDNVFSQDSSEKNAYNSLVDFMEDPTTSFLGSIYQVLLKRDSFLVLKIKSQYLASSPIHIIKLNGGHIDLYATIEYSPTGVNVKKITRTLEEREKHDLDSLITEIYLISELSI